VCKYVGDVPSLAVVALLSRIDEEAAGYVAIFEFLRKRRRFIDWSSTGEMMKSSLKLSGEGGVDWRGGLTSIFGIPPAYPLPCNLKAEMEGSFRDT